MPAQYSLDTSPLSWVTLPVAPRFGSSFNCVEDEDVRHETDGGQTWIYRCYSAQKWELHFRVTEAQLASFRTLHDAVDGALNPFYFKIDSTQLYCRKESGFDPHMLESPTSPRMFDYTLILTEELLPQEF